MAEGDVVMTTRNPPVEGKNFLARYLSNRFCNLLDEVFYGLCFLKKNYSRSVAMFENKKVYNFTRDFIESRREGFYSIFFPSDKKFDHEMYGIFAVLPDAAQNKEFWDSMKKYDLIGRACVVGDKTHNIKLMRMYEDCSRWNLFIPD